MTSGQIQTHNLLLLEADFFGMAGEGALQALVESTTKRARQGAVRQLTSLAKFAKVMENQDIDAVSLLTDKSGQTWIAFHRQVQAPKVVATLAPYLPWSCQQDNAELDVQYKPVHLLNNKGEKFLFIGSNPNALLLAKAIVEAVNNQVP